MIKIDINNILNPLNALALGNSFKDEYSFYKYKKVSFNNQSTEKENMLTLIMAYRFNLTDLSYLLDINTHKSDIYSTEREQRRSQT